MISGSKFIIKLLRRVWPFREGGTVTPPVGILHDEDQEQVILRQEVLQHLNSLGLKNTHYWCSNGILATYNTDGVLTSITPDINNIIFKRKI